MVPGETLWQPWLAIAVLGVAAVVTLATNAVQIRGLPRAVRTLRRQDAQARMSTWLFLAGGTGMGAVGGATLAVVGGGPGALPWMWIATILGMALVFADGELGRHDKDGVALRRRVGGGVGRLLAILFALGTLATAVAVGGAFQSHQAAAVLRQATGFTPGWGAVLVAGPAGLAWVIPALRGPLLRLVLPLGLVAYAGVALALVFQDPFALELAIGDAINGAFGVGQVAAGAGGGTVAVALSLGVLRATMTTEAGVGSAGWSRDPATLITVPIVSGLLATMTALVVITAGQRDTPVAGPELVPLEIHQSRGLRPSAAVGQTIVLPEDTTLESGKAYGMTLRSDPRGHRFAKFEKADNAVILPAWEIAAETSSIRFQSRAPDEAKHAAWDVRIPAKRELLDDARGGQVLKLTPIDETVQLTDVITRFELSAQPFVDLGDFNFPGQVSKASSPDASLGDHLAMFEAPAESRPFNPKFHEFFRGGFRGPYAQSEDPAPPFGFIASADFAPEIGSVVRLELRANPRGESFVRVNRAGRIEAPAWGFLMRAREVIVRNDSDETKDVRVAVEPELDAHRLSFRAADPQWEDFRRVAKMEGFSGPYLVPPNLVFEAEVHGDARLSADAAGRRTLVPLHPRGQIEGPYGDALPYAPHPGEPMAMGMAGPFLVEEGSEIIAAEVERRAGSSTPIAFAIAVFILAITTVLAWSEYGAAAAGDLLGEKAGVFGRLFVLGGAAVGGSIALPALLPWVDTALALAVAPSLLLAMIALPRLRAAAKGESETDDGEDSDDDEDDEDDDDGDDE